jgi:hypothetical protein
MYEYFRGLNMPLTVVHLGPKKWKFPIQEPLYYYYVNSMKTEPLLYFDTLHHADLFCGTNAVSVTLSTAVHFQTPSILLQNEKAIDFSSLGRVLPKMPQWYQEMARDIRKVGTFRMFPWGWYRFLEPVFERNPYTECFVTAPILKPKQTMNILRQYLTDEMSIQQLKDKQACYSETLKKLAPVGRFLETFG